MSTQNIYDQPDFFEAYGRLRRSTDGLAGAAEWPSLRSMLPPIAGARVLDLGCGYGWFAAYAADAEAAMVLAVDVSERMLARAQTINARPVIDYERANLETLALPADSFDLAFSSLALHYVEDLPRLLREVAGSLAPAGVLVASVEHPIYTAPRHPGWTVTADGARAWALGNYFDEGPRRAAWLGSDVVKHHRTLTSLLANLQEAGFMLERLEEYRASAEQLSERQELAVELERPMFLLLRASKAHQPF
ncbi:MAG TPA: class I SAM-dependent methyltransferase [Caulobacteraceae bacterium]|jgi:SAM-dependent methyltransferase